MSLPQALIEPIVTQALAEDLSGRGDLTSRLTVPADAKAHFVIAARDSGVLSGVEIAHNVFHQIDGTLQLIWDRQSGDTIERGATIAEVSGSARSILAAERVALNFLGRLSGIATLTSRYVDAITGTKAEIAHTRKTTPLLRALEVQAVKDGGGSFHRFNLSDAILIKDNHIAVCGSAGEAVRQARSGAGHMTRIAVEIDHLNQLEEVLKAGADSVLLDNFKLGDLMEAVAMTEGRARLEASGGVTLETVRSIAETGVNVISVGALTHSAPNFDFGLDAS